MPLLAVENALDALGVTETTLTPQEKSLLDTDGYLILPDILAASQLEAIRARIGELIQLERKRKGEDAQIGCEEGVIRISTLIDKGEVFRKSILHPRVLAAVAHVLDNDFVLGDLHTRLVLAGQGRQPLHRDHDLPDPPRYLACQFVWLLDDFTLENGPTRLVPGSHRLPQTPAEAMADPLQPHPKERHITGRAGTVVVVNSHLWHGGTLNHTAKPRWSLHGPWARRDFIKSLLAHERLDGRMQLRPETWASMTPSERLVFGFEIRN